MRNGARIDMFGDMRNQIFVGGTATDFVAKDLGVPMPIVAVEPDSTLFPQGGICVISGREGAGKTQLVFSLARSIINGTPFLGKYPVRQGRVAYVSFDMPLTEVQDRVSRMINMLEFPERLYISASDSPIDITTTDPDSEWVVKLLEFEPDIIMLDTLAKMHYLNENKADTVAKVFGHMKRVFGGYPTQVPIHHEGQEHPDPDMKKDDRDKLRGSTAWAANSDLNVRVSAKRSLKGSVVEVSFPRVRFCPEQYPITCVRNKDTLLLRPSEA